MTKEKKKMQTQEMGTGAKPIFDMSRAVPIVENTSVAEGKNRRSWRQALERVMEQQRQLPEPDYSLPVFNDPDRLREWMNVLGITQEDLAREADVSRQLISQIENGRPFSEPSRTKIWRAIFRLNDEQIKQKVIKEGEQGIFDSGNFGFASLSIAFEK